MKGVMACWITNIRQHGRTEQSTSRRTLTLRVHQLEANRSHLETGVASTEAVIWTQSRFPATRPARAPTLAVLTRAHSESKGQAGSPELLGGQGPAGPQVRGIATLATTLPVISRSRSRLSVLRHLAWIASLTHVRSSLTAKMRQAQLEHAAEMHRAQPRCSSVAVLITSSQKKKPR